VRYSIDQLERNASLDINLHLPKAANIILEDDIRFVESPNISPAPSFLVKVLKLDGSTFQSEYPNEDLIILYGPNSEDARFLDLDERIVIVPADEELILEVNSIILLEREKTGADYYGFLEFLVDNQEKGYLLEHGNQIELSLAEYALPLSFEVIQSEVSNLFSELGKAERSGFYVSDQKRKTNEVNELIEEARGKLQVKQYTNSISDLRIGYLKIISIIEELEGMGDTARTGINLIPTFLAVFTIATAVITFDQRKRKISSSLIYYAIAISIFLVVYPHSGIVDLTTLAGIIALSLLLPFLIMFGVPSILKEKAVYGRPPISRLISVLFSLAKRNVRRKKVRTLLTVTSIATVIFAMTVFTSVTRFQDIFVEAAESSYQFKIDSAYIRNVPEEKDDGSIFHFLPISPEDVAWLREQEGINNLAAKAESLPREEEIGNLIAGERSIKLWGIIGFSDEEGIFTDYEQSILTSGKGVTESDQYSIMISQSAAMTLQISIGSTVNLLENDFTVTGFFSDSTIGNLEEIDSKPFIPSYLEFDQDTGEYVLMPTNPSQVIIMRYEDAIELFKPLGRITVSRVILNTNLSEPEEDEFIKYLLQSREYISYVQRDDSTSLFYLGVGVEWTGLTVLIPIIIAGLNIIVTMINVVQGREKEMALYTTVGLSPSHIAILIIAEGLVMGLLGGGLGYLSGLLSYRLFIIFAIDIAVRPNLEWYWSVGTTLVALLISLLATIKPAMNAMLIAVPSGVRQLKLTQKEKEIRKEKITETYVTRDFRLTFKILQKEKDIFSEHMLGKFEELKSSFTYRIEDLEFEESKTDTGEIMKFKFNYIYGPYESKNELVGFKKEGSDIYELTLRLDPKFGVPEKFIKNNLDFVNEAISEYKS
jgi:hypothetical protein